jgi:ketosteroid isomerase-like protein
MILNHPETLAEIEAAFRAYEAALREEDISTLDALFHDSPFTVRFGAGEALYGYDAIAASRRARGGTLQRRRIDRSLIATYGRYFATVDAEFTRDDSGPQGRLSLSWVRFVDGWKIVSAHLSIEH